MSYHNCSEMYVAPIVYETNQEVLSPVRLPVTSVTQDENGWSAFANPVTWLNTDFISFDGFGFYDSRLDLITAIRLNEDGRSVRVRPDQDLVAKFARPAFVMQFS